MQKVIRFGALVVEPVYTEREVNFRVHQGMDYLFRLVPTIEGFEISPLDKALDATLDLNIVERVCHHLDRYYL